MARVFITGSSDGLGRMAAQLLIEQGHRVVLHARNERRGEEALAAVPGAEAVVIGDLSSIAQTRSVAEQVNRLGSFDGVIHNAGHRLSGAPAHRDRRRPASCVRRQHARTVHPDRADPATQAPRLPEFRPSPER